MEWAHEGVEAIRKYAKLSERNRNVKTKLVKGHTVKNTIFEQISEVKRRIATLETQLGEA